MNDDQLKRSWRIGLVSLGLIPVLQLCYLAYFARFYQQNGIDFVTVLSSPPPSVFVMMPLVAIVAAVCLAFWVGFLAVRKTIGLVHVSICQVVLLLMALHLTLVVLRTSGMAQLVQSTKRTQQIIDEHDSRYTKRIQQLLDERRTQNQRSDGIVTNVPNHQP